MQLIAPLFDGPIDIVGDVHGEFKALTDLLAKLGYDDDGHHAEGRRLVFAGDLTDRGPDSPAVLELVSRLVESGCAQTIAGNHELNLLRGDKKHGNGWWTAPEDSDEHPQKPITEEQRARFAPFLARLPLALERSDLRVVHACWRTKDIEKLRRREHEGAGICELHDEYNEQIERDWDSPEKRRAVAEEVDGVELHDSSITPPPLPLHAGREAARQTSNPIKVLTSGVEQVTKDPFFTSGKWRAVERVKWWDNYDDATPVVIGHYWRHYKQLDETNPAKDGPDLFASVQPHEWMGRGRNVYCVDFSVGRRPELRAKGKPEQVGQLAALRTPEWKVIHDHDEAGDVEIGAPGRSR
jgi:hypothetical protein